MMMINDDDDDDDDDNVDVGLRRFPTARSLVLHSL